MRIAVYPGSFDPMHIGHLAIMEYLNKLPQYEMIYLVVSPQNPFKDPNMAQNAMARFEAARKTVSKYPYLKVKVENIELSLPAPQYTIHTLDALKAREKDKEFSLVVGGDNFQDILKWKEAPRILKEYGLVVYPRPGFDTEAIRKEIMNKVPESRIEILNGLLVDVSSTEIRAQLAENKDVSKLLI